MTRPHKILLKLKVVTALFVYLSVCAWCSMVIYYHCPFLHQLCAWTYWTVAIASVVPVLFIKRKHPIVSIILLFMPLPVIVWWFTITPTNDANWQTPWSRMPEVEIHKNILTVNNIRDFNYRSENDYDVKYISDDYDLDKLDKVMLILSYWDGNTAVAHTILDFGFKDDRWLAISSETRLINGQQQTAVGGLFKQYGSLYIIGTEADLLMLRTNFRKEQVYMYQLKITPENGKILLLDLVDRINKLIIKPKFYNTITSNCMTSLIPSLRKIAINQDIFLDIRFLLNGYSDQMIYENSNNAGNISYEQFKKEHYITKRMEKVSDRGRYSAILHEDTPPTP